MKIEHFDLTFYYNTPDEAVEAFKSIGKDYDITLTTGNGSILTAQIGTCTVTTKQKRPVLFIQCTETSFLKKQLAKLNNFLKIP